MLYCLHIADTEYVSLLGNTNFYMNEGLDGGVWYSLFIKNLAHYSSH